eukprot:2134038-Rhodomonas_salina.1
MNGHAVLRARSGTSSFGDDREAKGSGHDRGHAGECEASSSDCAKLQPEGDADDDDDDDGAAHRGGMGQPGEGAEHAGNGSKVSGSGLGLRVRPDDDPGKDGGHHHPRIGAIDLHVPSHWTREQELDLRCEADLSRLPRHHHDRETRGGRQYMDVESEVTPAVILGPSAGRVTATSLGHGVTSLDHSITSPSLGGRRAGLSLSAPTRNGGEPQSEGSEVSIIMTPSPVQACGVRIESRGSSAGSASEASVAAFAQSAAARGVSALWQEAEGAEESARSEGRGEVE